MRLPGDDRDGDRGAPERGGGEADAPAVVRKRSLRGPAAIPGEVPPRSGRSVWFDFGRPRQMPPPALHRPPTGAEVENFGHFAGLSPGAADSASAACTEVVPA